MFAATMLPLGPRPDASGSAQSLALHDARVHHAYSERREPQELA